MNKHTEELREEIAMLVFRWDWAKCPASYKKEWLDMDKPMKETCGEYADEILSKLKELDYEKAIGKYGEVAEILHPKAVLKYCEPIEL